MEFVSNKLYDLMSEQQKLILENLNSGIYVADMESYQLLFVNEYIKKLFGEDIIGRPCYEVFQNRSVPCNFCTNSKLIKDGVPQPPYIWEHQNPKINSWVRCIVRVIKWVDGRYVRLQVAMNIDERKLMEEELIKHRNHLQHLVDERTRELQQEIDKHKQSEQKLKESESRYKALVESLPVGLYQVDEEGVYVYTTGVSSKILGLSTENILGKKWFAFLHPEDREWVIEEWRDCAQKQQPFKAQFRLVRADGNVVWVKVLANSYIGDGRKRRYLATLTDITESKNAEAELRIEAERFAKTFVNCPSAVCIVNLANLNYIDVNKSWLTLTGYSRQEIIGRRFSEFKIWDDNSRIFELWKTIKENGAFYNDELILLTKTGEQRIGLTSAVIINLEGTKCVSIVVHDITDYKKMEKELNRLDRLNLVGQMAAGIGHEIRNPITTVRGLLQILGGKAECAQYKERYDLMISELDRANSIITEYLSLAKKAVTYLESINLNQILETLFPLLMADALNAGKDVVLELYATPDLMLDQKEIRQLILNLVRNGLDAMSSGGKLTISTYLEDEQVVLAVKDEGTGIERDVIDKIGTPFFTTKAEGTGLGLATCYTIANRHNAAISVDTGSQGTTFYVKFKLT